MIKPPKGGRNLVLLGTGLLVVFLLSYYFFTYIPAREKQMNQRGIRVINRLDKNLQERVEHYKKSVSQFECDYYLSNLSVVEDIKGNSIYFKLFNCDSLKTGNGDNYESNELNKRLFEGRDSIRKYFNSQENAELPREKRAEQFNNMLSKFVKKNQNEINEFKQSIKPNASVDKLIEAYGHIDQTKVITIDSIVSDWSGKAYAYLGITYANALKRIDNGVLFKEIILSEPDSHRVVNQNQLNLKYFEYIPSNENDPNILEALVPEASDNNEAKKTEEHHTFHIENVDITKKTISGIDYMCFTRFVEIQGKPFYLTGIIEQDEYNAGVRQVSIWVVLVFILLSLFFILVLPIAKPFLLSKKERLQASDLMWSALALVFGISILSLLIIGVDTFAIEEKNLVSKKLAWHTDSIKSEFQSELEISIIASQMSSVFNYRLDHAEATSAFMNNAGFLSQKIRRIDSLRKAAYTVSDTTDKTAILEKQNTLVTAVEKVLSEESTFISALSFTTALDIEFIRISPSGNAQLYKIAELPDDETVTSITNSFDSLKISLEKKEDTTLLINYIEYQEAIHCVSFDLYEINNDLDLSHRAYYQVMKDKEPRNAWTFRSAKEPDVPYYMESIFSMSSGKFTTITVTKGDSVAQIDEDNNYSYATDFEWESVNNRYLEPGYTFAIIDKEGSIHFHSDQRKIKNQNFIEETDFDTKLSSFMHNKTAQGFGLKFSMKDHEAFVSPLANTPWFVVVMYDIRKSRLNVTQSIITTFQVLIMILLYMLFLHIILHIDKTVSSHGQKHVFSYLFLSPLNISSRVFIFLTAFNLFQILLLIIVYSMNSINLLANITTFFAFITIGILVNYQTLTKYNLTLLNLKQVGESKRVSGFEWVLLVLWVFWFVLTSIVSDAGYLKYIQLIQVIIVACYLYLKVESPWKTYFLSVEFEQPYFKKILGGYFPFYMHSFTWIVLIGVVSTFLFFKPIYNMQHIKRGLNNWVEEFEVKNSDGFVTQPDHKINLFSRDASDSTYIENNFVRNSSDFADQISLYFDEDEGSFIGQGRSLEEIEVHQYRDAELGTPFFYIDPKRSTHRQNLVKTRANAIVAFDLPSIDHTEDRGLAILFWLSIILFMWVVFFMVQALGKKFFYLNLLRRLRAVSDEVDDKKVSLNKVSISGFSDKITNLMLVGPPYSGRNTIAKGLIQKSKTSNYLDFFNKLDEEAKKIDLEFIRNPIIINNFDYRNLDYKLNEAKLDLLERIIRLRNEHQILAPLVLISTFSTNQIIAFYKDRVKELMKNSSNNEDEIQSLISSVYRWESILFGFTTYMVKLSHTPSSDFIDNELTFGSTLLHIKPQIKEFEKRLIAQKSGLTEEDIEAKLVEAITDMAQNYYSAIWNACSQEEKFLLYDMAQDGLVNPKNERALSLLVKKGLLLTTPVLRIFNRSFALFVIENISEEDGAQMERQAKKEGVWMTYKYLALFLVIVMIVFVAFVEKEMINKMTGLITAGGILLPRVVSFASSLGNIKLFGNKAT